MTKKTMFIQLALGILCLTAVHAGTQLHFRCQAKPEADPVTGKTPTPCGFESQVNFGGGKLFQQVTGYCRQCKKFVYITWARESLPPRMIEKLGANLAKRQPKPLGEVWDARTGKAFTVHACPDCKGPFIEIKSSSELNHCPACNKPHFGVDKGKPVLMFD